MGRALLLLAALPSVLEATPAQVRAPLGGQAVWVGSVVEVAWYPLPREAEEMELFLSLDGGKTFPLRLTPQLPPGLDAVRWLVPNLPTPAARLRLRVGIPGQGEVDAPPSDSFPIVAGACIPAEPVALFAGELWLGRGGDAGPPVPPSLGRGTPELFGALSLFQAAETPRRFWWEPPSSALYDRRTNKSAHLPHVPPPPVPRETTPQPLRR